MSKKIRKGYKPPPERSRRPDKPTPEPPPKQTSGFEAPMWAHARMKKLGLDPYSGEDWLEFKAFCE